MNRVVEKEKNVEQKLIQKKKEDALKQVMHLQ